MVCNRCIMAIENEAQQLNWEIHELKLGQLTLSKNVDDEAIKKFTERIVSIGFGLIDDKKLQIIEKIKNSIIELVHHQNDILKTNLSDFLSNKIDYDYPFLSNLFSEMEGITIEKYFIKQKIEKVKELLVYDELSLSEIAFQLNYSSVAYLSNQFKKITGLTPSQFKNSKKNQRKAIDSL